ncbi:hypothetical protein FOQG_08676 [Fusarium oxysporum f. sp. raphani 54005]|uniref:Uncharacterized protein n=3 Tax=Fusarium oxysporum TaxID=5507 RepID=X0CAB8_FUSOX|nr:hypothetical protein FOVG_04213 [Fusarium oxysporum f. sp. pisi HDV247]EXK87774.1 hypothetical protein FOQG_08676 [Fusarium oxysporum f. sp. raphani 54005]EXL85771.1 hypothetical protein FOPG_02543 [Fusarium oxysporum f. sp. conglutinans race 2 54008]
MGEICEEKANAKSCKLQQTRQAERVQSSKAERHSQGLTASLAQSGFQAAG